MKNGMCPDKKPECRPDAEMLGKAADEQANRMVECVLNALQEDQLPAAAQKEAHRIPTVGFANVDYCEQK